MQATDPIAKTANDRGVGRRTFRAAAWLGWQIESNWADPLIFFIYSVIKPLSGAAILVVMYSVITQGAFDEPMFAYIYLGNAFYIYVAAVLTGVSWTVIDDREIYRMLKYIYIAPVHVPVYLLGRGFAKFVFGSLAVFITIAVGALYLNLPLGLSLVNWPLFVISLALGIVMLAMMGLVLGSIMLLIVNNANFIGEAVAGALYLFSGAVFPLSILPGWLQPVGYIIPISYWLELLRRAVIGQVAESFPTFSQFSDMQLLGILAGLTVVFTIVALVLFRICDRVARERGYIDRVTNY